MGVECESGDCGEGENRLSVYKHTILKGYNNK